MADSCSCSAPVAPVLNATPPEHTPIWQVRDLQLAALSGVLLGVGLLASLLAAPAILLGELPEAAMLAFLFSIAEGLEGYARTRTRNNLRSLLALAPREATVLRGGTSATLALKDLRVGDLLMVKPGERLATDGVIRSGRTALDTSVVTGESVPVEAGPGDPVWAGTINGTGRSRWGSQPRRRTTRLRDSSTSCRRPRTARVPVSASRRGSRSRSCRACWWWRRHWSGRASIRWPQPSWRPPRGGPHGCGRAHPGVQRAGPGRVRWNHLKVWTL